MVIAGFEPLDILQSIWMVLKQIEEGRAKSKTNMPSRPRSREYLPRGRRGVYELREFFEWRGLGSIDHSGVKIGTAYGRFDAERKFGVPNVKIADPNAASAARSSKA